MVLATMCLCGSIWVHHRACVIGALVIYSEICITHQSYFVSYVFFSFGSLKMKASTLGIYTVPSTTVPILLMLAQYISFTPCGCENCSEKKVLHTQRVSLFFLDSFPGSK